MWQWYSGRIGRWTYNVLIFVADVLEDVFWKVRPRPKLTPSDVVHLDDEELLRKVESGPPLQDSSLPFGGFSTQIVDEKIVAKYVLDMDQDDPHLNREFLAMQSVWENTTIPIPRAHRVLQTEDSWTIIVMDFIEGERFDRAWPKLSLWSRMSIAWTLRSYVRQLRRIPVPPRPFPGPLGPEPSPSGGEAFSLVHHACYELKFDTTQQLLDKFKRTAENRFRRYQHTEPRTYPEIENPGPLVFTHHDLNMRNIILGQDGTVWLLDWNYSGFFPKYFEYMGMYFAANNTQDGVSKEVFPYIPFVTDPHFPVFKWLHGNYPYGSWW